MDHVVYVNAKTNELEKLLEGNKTMIIRGAAGRKLPHGRVEQGHTLYFVRNNAEGLVRARANVAGAYHSEKLTPQESHRLVHENQDSLQLEDTEIQRWAGKRYLVLVTVDHVTALDSFAIDKSKFGNMDDWLLVEDIAAIKV
jgi:hypothetical protein